MNYSDVSLVHELEEKADELGFRLIPSRFDYKSIAMTPKGEYDTLDAQLPVFSRGTEFGFGGSVEGNLAFLYGWEKCLAYLRVSRLITEEKIAKRNMQLNEQYKRRDELLEQQKTLETLKK